MKYILSILMLCLCVNIVSAQDVYTSSGRPQYAKKKEKKTKGYDPSRLIVGGGFAAGFGAGYADLGISPTVGYRFTDKFSAGIGLGYEYLQNPTQAYDQYTGTYNVYSATASIISPSIWGRYFIFRNVFLTGIYEYDLVYTKQPDYDANGNIITSSLNVNASCLLLGAGIRQPLGGRVSVVAEMLYDVLQEQYSPYLGQPTVRIGILAGL